MNAPVFVVSLVTGILLVNALIWGVIARTTTSYRSRRRGGYRFLVLTTREQSEAAFTMRDDGRWTSALTNAGVSMGHG